MSIGNIMDLGFFFCWPDFRKKKHLDIHRDISNSAVQKKKCRCLYSGHKLPTPQNGSVSHSFKCKFHQVIQNVSWNLLFSFSHLYRLIDVTSSLAFLQTELLPQSEIQLLWIFCLFMRSSHKGNSANRDYSPTKLVWGRECGRHREDYLQVVDW